MDNMKVCVLEMPVDFGASRHGADMGPSAIRLAGLNESITELGHEVSKYFSPVDIKPQEYVEVGNPKAKYLVPIVKACTQLADEVKKTVEQKMFPIVLGGDHSIILGTLAGLSSAFKGSKKRLGVLYIDAHGDFNTCETTLTGNIHGMCLSGSCGYGIHELTDLYEEGQKVDPRNVCYVGLRDIDPEERKLMKSAGVTAYTMSDIDRLGFTEVLRQILSFIENKVDVLHVSCDMDAIDPMFAPGVGIPLPGGLTYREALLLAEEVFKTSKICSAEIVEVNPVLDVRNQTAIMAVEILSRLLGKTLY